MKLNGDFLTSGPGQLVLVGLVLALGAGVIHLRQPAEAANAMPAPKPAPSVPLPRTLTREVAKFTPPAAPVPTVAAMPSAPVSPPTPAPNDGPLVLFVAAAEPVRKPMPVTAPFGRLVPCETVVAIESNRLDTPIIGLVTEDVWHAGTVVIPAGAEVHGKAALDRARERLASQGNWRIVWRTADADNGTELETSAIVLDREFDGRNWSEHDGSAGLRGRIVKTDDERELKLFAATFLASATSALQELRPGAGLLGESSVPVATARNAVLAGTGAVLREYAESLRAAIAKDGFYLRVPAGKPFYLYLTETLDRSQGRQPPAAPPRL